MGRNENISLHFQKSLAALCQQSAYITITIVSRNVKNGESTHRPMEGVAHQRTNVSRLVESISLIRLDQSESETEVRVKPVPFSLSAVVYVF